MRSLEQGEQGVDVVDDDVVGAGVGVEQTDVCVVSTAVVGNVAVVAAVEAADE